MTNAIETLRLRIVPFTERHVTTRYIGWLNDRQLMRYSEQRHRTHTRESCDAYRRSFQGTPHGFWAVEEHVEGLGHIGNINAYVDEPNRLADVGLLIGEARAAGRRYGLEAWLGVCSYLLDTRGCRKVTGGTLAENTAMLSIMRRAGMVPDGQRVRHYMVEGREVDLQYWAMFRSSWLPWLASEEGSACRALLKPGVVAPEQESRPGRSGKSIEVGRD